MTLRSIALIATLALTSSTSAFAWDDDDPGDLGSMERGSAGDVDDTEGDGFEFEEPEEDFDLLDADVTDEPKDEPSPRSEGEMLGDFSDLGGGDDDFMQDFTKVEKKKASSPAAMPGPIKLQVNGKDAWADNYPLSLLAVDRDAVVVELPVLVAKSRVGNDDGFALVAEAWVGKTKTASVVQTFTPASLAEFGPTFAFVKMVVPVVENKGEVKVVIHKAAKDGSGATEVFARTTPYALQ